MAGGHPQVDDAIAYASSRLRTELPGWLRYHDLEHTAGLVVPAAELLADDLGLAPAERDLVRTAAWFHDLGFVEAYEANEGIAVRIAGEVLPGFGYEPAAVDVVVTLIWATRVPQAPRTLLAEVLCDADLFVLGTDRFEERERALREELAITGVVHDDASWNRTQVAFLEAHRYFTEPAKARNDATKRANLAMVLARPDGAAPAS